MDKNIKELKQQENRQKNLFNLLQETFEIYKKYEGKSFLFITNDYFVYEGHFLARDFVHLTGIVVNGSDVDFYNNLKNNRILDYKSISIEQKYTNNDINKKIAIIKEFDNFITNSYEKKNVIIEDYHSLTTSSVEWKFALRNDDKRFTLCFKKQETQEA